MVMMLTGIAIIDVVLITDADGKRATAVVVACAGDVDIDAVCQRRVPKLKNLCTAIWAVCRDIGVDF